MNEALSFPDYFPPASLPFNKSPSTKIIRKPTSKVNVRARTTTIAATGSRPILLPFTPYRLVNSPTGTIDEDYHTQFLGKQTIM